ncbi:MAG: type II secretion system F family protein [Actinomycetota bacterium]
MGTLAGVLAALSMGSVLLSGATRVDPAVLRLFAPQSPSRAPWSGSTRLLSGVAAMGGFRRIARLDRLEERIATSGTSLSLVDLLAIKACSSVAILALLVVVHPQLVAVAVLAAGGAFIAPDAMVMRVARGRSRRIDAEIPQFLDLLAASSSAGLAAPAAIRRATSGLRGPLADELHSASRAVEAGARWRDELRALAGRLGLPDLGIAVAVVGRSEQLGSSLAEELRRVASEVREARRARATERARTAPVKMLFPLVFMVLPAFLLLTVVPVLIATVRSLD